MRCKHLIGLGALAGVLLLVGCDNNSKDRMSLLEQENTELRDQLSERDRALEATNSDLREANRLLREQEDMYASQPVAASTGSVSTPTAFDGIEGVSTSTSGREVTITVASDVLFDSGRTTLKKNAKRSLDQVADVLRTRYNGRPVQVIGHTDTDPIRKSGYKSNYHLGFERGWAVRKYLVDQGVTGTNMAIISFGPDRPMGSASTSRRVEIVVAA